MNVQELKIDGMTCEGCAHTISEALQAAGATGVRVDFATGTATLTPGDTDPEVIRAAVEAGGYTLVEATESADPQDGPSHRAGPAPVSHYDLVVIGSGSAAFAAGIRARDLGKTVAMCESNIIGGTCVNIGCVPSKALIAAAETYHHGRMHPFPGVPHLDAPVDMATIGKWKDDLVDDMRAQKYENLAAEYGFTLLCGHGSFTGPDTYVCDGQVITADQFLIATGASPWVPPIDGLAEAGYLTSSTALSLKELPSRLAVIGGNAIGLELAQTFSRLGAEVTVFEAVDRIAPFEEPEISALLEDVFAEDGIDVMTGVSVTSVTRSGDDRAITFTDADGTDREIVVDQVLVATGRRPNTASLGLAAAGVETDRRGGVVTDDYLQTTNPRIWAAGDVTARAQFVYVAAAQGSIAADNAFGGQRRTVDWDAMPRVSFTSPQIASVGLTAAQAEQAGHTVDSRTLGLDAVPRALVTGETRGLFKVVADAETGRVLGVHLLAQNAGDVILAGVYALSNAMTVTDIATQWCPYLTMAEGLKLTAQTFTRDVKKLSCCAA